MDGRLADWNRAARHIHWVVLRDLDHDAECAPELVAKLLPRPAPGMALRVAVRAVEAWFLGDAETLADFVGVPVARVPTRPEELADPKSALLELARRTRKRALREGMVPRPKSGAVEGPEYVSLLVQYALEHWRPGVAALRCDSLCRCMKHLHRWLQGDLSLPDRCVTAD